MSRYPPPELKPVGRGQPASLSPSQEEHLSNQPASPSLSRLIKITNQRGKLHCEAADRANFKTNYCTHREAVWPERLAQIRRYARCLTEQTQERACVPSKTHNKAILLMQLFSTPKCCRSSFWSNFQSTRVMLKWQNFLLGRNRLSLEAQPKLAADWGVIWKGCRNVNLSTLSTSRSSFSELNPGSLH